MPGFFLFQEIDMSNINIEIAGIEFEYARERERVDTQPGQSIIADHGSIVIAGEDSLVVAERCSFVIAGKGSNVIALPGSIVNMEQGANVNHCRNSIVLNREINMINPPFEFARGKGQIFADNRIIVAYPGAEFEAGHNSVILALSLAKFKTGNYSLVLATGFCHLTTGINSKIQADSTCTIRKDNVLPFAPSKARGA